MMGAIGAWLGIINGVVVLVMVSVFGILIAIGVAVAKKKLVATSANLLGILGWLLLRFKGRGVARQLARSSPPEPEPMARMPYGLAILAGVCAAAIGMLIWRA